MRNQLTNRCLFAAAELLLLLAINLNAAASTGTQVTTQDLIDAGLNLPSYMPTLQSLLEYQGKLTFHQELDVEWDSLPGRSGRFEKRDVAHLPLAPNFTLLNRHRKVPGTPAGDGRGIRARLDALIIVSVTAHKEVRGILLRGDPRESFGEDLRPGKQQSWTYITPKATIPRIQLPDDPEIDRILFFKVDIVNERMGEWRLKEVGSLRFDFELI